MALASYPSISTWPVDHTAQPRILIADDEETSAHALQMYLTRQGYQVRVVYGGQRALDETRHYRPHLLILDFLMPDLNGLEVIMQLRSDPTQNYIPVIMITAQDEERKRLQSMVSGADDYLAKPVNDLEMLVRVQALLRTKHQLDALMSQNQVLLDDLASRNAELEKALLAVEEANLLKRNIIHAVSHEMGTPMLQVKSAVHLMVEDIIKNDPDNRPAQLVLQAVLRLEGIISNFNDLARAENLKFEPFVVGDAFDHAVRLIEKRDGNKTNAERIQRHVESGLPPLLSDKRAVARVLFLLLDNALKFDPLGKSVHLSAQREDQLVRLQVQDKGIGIPAEHLQHIFKEFFQGETGTTRRFGGSGLGLALAKLLCDKMGTVIEVESTVGKGSTFSILLPIATL